MEINELNEAVNINYNAAPMLSDRIRDAEFMLECIKTKYFFINEIRLDLNITATVLKSYNIKEQTELLCYCKKIQKVLKLLNINQDLNISAMSEQELLEMDNLVTALVDKKTVCNLRKGISLVNKIKIQDIILLIVIEETYKGSDNYNITNFFQSNLIIEYSILDSDEKFITSKYSILQKEDYIQISNIDYDSILSSYQKLLEKNPAIFERANMDMLNMLSAYDVNKNKELLKVAKDMAEWILKEDKNNIEYEIKLLNYLQIVRRERSLKIDEVKLLCSLTESSKTSEEIKVAAYLLLGNQIAAEMHFLTLNNELQNAFRCYPIFVFWTNT